MLKKLLRIKIFLLVAVFLLMVNISPVSAQTVTNDATLVITPSSGSYPVGETFSVQVLLSSPTNTIAAVDLFIEYDSSTLEYVSLTQGSSFDTNTTSTSNNLLTSTVTTPYGSDVVTPNNEIVATITFRPLTESSNTSLTFSLGDQAGLNPDTAVSTSAATGGQNVLSTATGSSYTTTSGGSLPGTGLSENPTLKIFIALILLGLGFFGMSNVLKYQFTSMSSNPMLISNHIENLQDKFNIKRKRKENLEERF